MNETLILTSNISKTMRQNIYDNAFHFINCCSCSNSEINYKHIKTLYKLYLIHYYVICMNCYYDENNNLKMYEFYKNNINELISMFEKYLRQWYEPKLETYE